MPQHDYTIFNLLDDGVVVIDREYRVVFVNQALARLYGIPPTEIIGRKCYEVSHGRLRPCGDDCLKGSRCSYVEVFGSGRPLTTRHRHTLPDGTSTLFEITTTAFALDEGGAATQLVFLFKDISEQERLRQEAEASHRELRQIFESAPFCISFVDRQMRVMQLNSAMESLIGMTAAAARGKYCYDCWGQYAHDVKRHGRERICDACQVSVALAEGEIRSYERWVGDRVFEVVTSPVRDVNGVIVGAMEIGNDITERKRVEEKLRESKERFRLIAETISEVFWMADVEVSTNFYVSPAYATVWGRSLESLRENPRSFVEAIHPNDVARVVAVLERQKEGQPFDHEYRIYRPDGALRWIRDRGFPVREPSGEVSRYVGIAQDITERKEAEQALRESENSYRALFEDSPHVLCIADYSGIVEYLAGMSPECAKDYGEILRENPSELAACLSRLRILRVNRAAMKLFGGDSEQELIEGVFTVIGQETMPQVVEGISVIGRGETFFEHEIILYHLLSRAKIHAILRWNVVPGYEASYRRVILSITDISARKHAEEKVAEHRSQLRKLSVQLLEIEEAERRRIARELHDKLGQQLTVLGINLHILGQPGPLGQDTAHSQRIADSLGLIEAMTQQVRDIMADLRPPVLDDYGLVAALSWYGRKFWQRNGIVCEVRATEIPRLPAKVEIALFRVVQEALTNVVKHSGASRVVMEGHVRDHLLSLSVRDNGRGFSRFPGPHGREGQGLGIIFMGERVEAIGGTLAVASSPGHGTTITIEVRL